MRLLLGGSPCTHWSIAQTRNRETQPKGLGWELFRNYLIAKERYGPDFYLYENNKSMAPAIRAQITAELGVEAILINSALVSAQSRQRLYWTNIPGVKLPEDRGIVLLDVLDSGLPIREKGYTLKANLWYNMTIKSVANKKGVSLMALENKLGITDSAELAKAEERIGKTRALEMFQQGLLGTFEVGTFRGLSQIHKYLFDEIYDFAGQVRTVNIAKGGFRFAPVLYLTPALKNISKMPQSTFDEIIAKYVEMNVAHPFREGNGRSTRLWLDAILKKELRQVVDWSKVDKDDYLLAMERSPIKDTEIKLLLKAALTDQINDREVYMKGVDASYRYEGYNTYKTGDI